MRQLQNDLEKIGSFYQNHRSNIPPDSAFTYGQINTATIGGIPSYIELLTCLEINRDLDKMRATSSDKPESGEAIGSRRKRR